MDSDAGPGDAALPRELLDLVHGYIPRKSLPACTLISKRWFYSARTCLFRRVTVRKRRYRSTPVDGQPVEPGEHTLGALERLLDLTSGTDRDVGILVKVLEFTGSGPYYPYVEISDLDRVLAKLPSLHTLWLARVVLAPCPAEALLLCSQKPKDLAILHLESVNISHPKPSLVPSYDYPNHEISGRYLVQLASMCGQVETLYIQDVGFGHISQGYSNLRKNGWRADPSLDYQIGVCIPRTFQVKKLLSYPYVQLSHADVLELLRSFRYWDSLEHLDVDETSEAVHQRLLRSVGSNICSIRLPLIAHLFDTRRTHKEVRGD